MKKQDLQRIADMLGGLLILGTLPDSPAARAGLRYGDILLSVNGEPTPDWATYVEVTFRQPHSQHMRIFRDGAELEFSLSFTEEWQGPALDLDHRGFVRALVKSDALVNPEDGLFDFDLIH